MKHLPMSSGYIPKRSAKECCVTCRSTVGMTVGFLRSYSLGVIHTCHKRGVHAMGGMAAQIPIKNDPNANQAAIDKASSHMHLLCRGAIDNLYKVDAGCLQGLSCALYRMCTCKLAPAAALYPDVTRKGASVKPATAFWV